ncbi:MULTISPECIES: glycoside hydrolase family 3 C-terminal domain-containing protein [unclassified Duganella]|uniref:glycoside hydrolase family 3 C-terminal domain-containing protein n=1 Tax=unclassified Duganella TaxID=2636909 RepID=UPI00070130B0|nr:MULTISPECIES: glycoside hydrolase family 3 C-terminal domain-containing protein [unclassified Duganella]KQV61470.1 beta-glucosidase [Duganella sp. Root336D2]KRB92440.1 beta-glucosidase [Duganella sp. Root198D2]
MKLKKTISLLSAAVALCCGPALAASDSKPWMNSKLGAAERADLVIREMTLDEKLKLVFGYFGMDNEGKKYKRPQESYNQSAGFVYGVPRLGIPNLWQTDAGVGVASQGGPQVRTATALPSGLNTAATWDPQTAFAGGAMIGAEARGYGFNVLLAGGVNLMRDPRNGRNFEYGGEDPLLAGRMVGAQIKGIQSSRVVSTLKHYALNDQETGRTTLNVKIDDQSARMSDLLALQIAKEEGNPGSVMCSYNRVNGVYACESSYLLNEVLKKDWGFKGWVMSDWGATHSTIPAANAGLDQQSGMPFDLADYFGAPLKEAVLNGWVPQSRLDDMARRVLHAMFEHGVVDHPVASEPGKIDFKANGAVSLKDAQEGMVLLKNQAGLLPLAKSLRRIAVIGGHADKGVLAGGGSSLVYPAGGNAVPGLEPKTWPGPIMYYPSSPLKAIQQRVPAAQVSFNDGSDKAAAAKLAQESDVVLVFATQWTGEAFDMPSLSLPGAQDELIAAVSTANPKTVVVLETGGPVSMPWLAKVPAVLEAWYPGTSGGEAIASVLFGEVNPSGHLPATFPASEAQLPRPVLDGYPEVADKRFDVEYREGAAVGYKWFDLKGLKPLFPFGHGLSYSEFGFSGLSASVKNGALQATFTVKNTGKVAGKEVAQVYVAPLNAKWEAPKRLAGFQKLALQPGAEGKATVTVDPRLLAMYDSASKTWNIAKGDYQVTLAADAAGGKAVSTVVHLEAASYDVNGKPLRR